MFATHCSPSLSQGCAPATESRSRLLVSVSTTIPRSSCVYNLRKPSEFFLHDSSRKAKQENPRFGCGLKAVLSYLLLWLPPSATTFDKHRMLRFTPYTTTLRLSGLPLNFAITSIATCALWLFRYDISVMVGLQKSLLNSLPL